VKKYEFSSTVCNPLIWHLPKKNFGLTWQPKTEQKSVKNEQKYGVYRTKTKLKFFSWNNEKIGENRTKIWKNRTKKRINIIY
jgi:hypothetical protein